MHGLSLVALGVITIDQCAVVLLKREIVLLVGFIRVQLEVVLRVLGVDRKALTWLCVFRLVWR